MISNEIEIWKPVKGWERCYEVSNFGNVRGKSRRCGSYIMKGMDLKPISVNNGYLMVHLYDSETDRQKMCLVHRLVAEAFIYNDDPANKLTINHINYDKHDNRKCNLEWATQRYNVQYSRNVAVVQIHPETGEVVAQYKSIVEAAAMNDGWKQQNISMCVCGHTQTAYKYKWMRLSKYAISEEEKQ